MTFLDLKLVLDLNTVNVDAVCVAVKIFKIVVMKINWFYLRTHISYVEQYNRINNASTADLKSYLSKQYGIRQRSALTAIEGFDLVMQTPQDIMHVLSEGVLQYEVRLVILTLKKKCITLCEQNAQIQNFDYGYSNTEDKPLPLRDTVFTTTSDKYKIKFSASQINTFILYYITLFI